MMRQTFIRLALAALLPLVSTLEAPAQVVPATEYEGASALGLALRRLGTTKRVLMIGAHPDDESSQILGTLALGQGAEVAYLSLTRGEGGQNGIGPELQEGLGLLRTEELLAARRLDGARQYFTRAYDFGYSKNAEEAFRHWPQDSLLADVVAVVRSFRPDIVISIFSGTPRDGHGQHQAAGILARQAYEVAGDPGRFPEQLRRGLRPHAPQKLYQALWRRDEGAEQTLATGEFDPLLGRSHYQVAMASRSRHRSQDMGRVLTPGPQQSALRLLEARGVSEAAAAASLFAGVDTTLAARATSADNGAGAAAAALAEYEDRVGQIQESANLLAPGPLVPQLAEALRVLRQAEERLETSPGEADLRFVVAAERAEAEEALALTAGVRLDAIADDETVVPGQSFELELQLWNGGARPIRVGTLAPALPQGWMAEALDPLPSTLQPGAFSARRFRVAVPQDAAPSEPYYLRQPRRGDLYVWPDEVRGVGVPFEAAPVRAEAEIQIEETPLRLGRDATFRGVDKMQGEFRRPVRIAPLVSLDLKPAVAILPVREGAAREQPVRFVVTARSEAPAGMAGSLRLELPVGWRADTADVPLSFTAPGEEKRVTIAAIPPAELQPGSYPVRAVFRTASGTEFTRGYSLIDYPHTQPRPLYDPAVSAIQALDIRLPADLRVGYVRGASDEVPEALAQLGVDVQLIDAEALASADLGAFDVIVTGARAYEVRPDLVAHNQRLLEYVERGGTLVVQYNKYEFTEPGIAPYPLAMARPHDRVTDEAAPIRLLDPEHRVFTRPNRITAEDFEGWVQERGLYFLREWDPRYTPLLETADPGEQPLRGGLVIAPYGEGTYVYTGLAFFRQLPAGVPGAYRLLANLLALGAQR